ncbi:MAG: serine hydrolase [Gemmatimonadetes bacterium]|nr:serine hydrolase [Gemmatimonadota bacterium]
MVHKFAAVAGRATTFRRFSRAVLALSALALFVPFAAPAQTVDWDRIDAGIETLLADWTTPGVAVAVVQNDSIVFARGYGVRTLGEPGPVGPETRFAVASNTKAFTAALLAQLQEEGKLSVDDRVIDHLPEFRMHDPWITQEIQIQDLMTHRSGLPTFGGDHLWIGQDLPRDEVVRRIRWLEPAGAFRASFHYQNLMYLVAGQVAAAAAGQNWDALMQERILGPLGMTGSSTTLAALAGIEDVASAHEKVGGELMPVEYDDVRGVAPAAALNSNVLDMAQWMRANLNGGEVDGTRIFSERAARAMQSVQYPLGVSPWAEANLGQRFSGYGFGWFIGEYRGRKVVTHSGGLTGMISLQTLLPEEGIGVVVLTNYAPSAPTRAITYTILDALLGEPERDWNSVYRGIVEQGEERTARTEAEFQASRIPDTTPSLDLEAYTGSYEDELSGPAEVRMEDGQLVFDYNPRHLGDLEHWNHDVFRVHWRHPIFDMEPMTFLQFSLGQDGAVESLTVKFYDPIKFERAEQ